MSAAKKFTFLRQEGLLQGKPLTISALNIFLSKSEFK